MLTSHSALTFRDICSALLAPPTCVLSLVINLELPSGWPAGRGGREGGVGGWREGLGKRGVGGVAYIWQKVSFEACSSFLHSDQEIPECSGSQVFPSMTLQSLSHRTHQRTLLWKCNQYNVRWALSPHTFMISTPKTMGWVTDRGRYQAALERVFKHDSMVYNNNLLLLLFCVCAGTTLGPQTACWILLL